MIKTIYTLILVLLLISCSKKETVVVNKTETIYLLIRKVDKSDHSVYSQTVRVKL